MKMKKPFKHRFVKESFVKDLKESFGYYAYENYKDWANRVSIMKGKIPLIGKAYGNSVFLHVKLDSELFNQYTQIPFLTSYDNPSAASLKVVWVRYIKEVDLHYALVCSGVRHYICGKNVEKEACVDLFIVPLKKLGLNIFEFEAPLYSSNRCSSYYEEDFDFLNNEGILKAPVIEGEPKSPIEFLEEKPYVETCQYTYSMDLLNYLYSYVYKQSELPKDTLPTDKSHEPRRYIDSAFVMCKDGLAEAIDELWGNKVTYPDYIDSTDFIRFAYDETDECVDGVGIEWTSFDDFMDNQWQMAPDDEDDFYDEE